VKSGNFLLNDVEAIAAAPQSTRDAVIPSLEVEFATSQDAWTKQEVATSLVRLGDKDDTYWNFLVALAIPAAEDDAPFPVQVDQNGHFAKKPSPDFVRWAADRHLELGDALEHETLDVPGDIFDLGFTRDPRAVSILQMALASPNYLVEAAAAEGLAAMGNRASVPLIIEACSRAPADAAAAIAMHLASFPGKDAQQAFDLYVPKDLQAAARDEYSEENSQGEGPQRDTNPSTPPANPHP